MKKYYMVNIVCVVLVFAAVICLMSFFPRSYGYIDEKRFVTKFPRFSVEAYFKGRYTAQISEWYTDSIPYRAKFKEATAALKSLYGVSAGSVSGHDLQPGAHDSRPEGDIPFYFEEPVSSAPEDAPFASAGDDIFGD